MPNAAAQPENTFEVRFGIFRFHAGKLDLSRHDIPIHLQTQPARLLRLLLSRAGELVTREDIQQTLWPDGTTVDFDMAVNRCIRQIREVLGDDSDAPRYIKTIPRLGYCFIAAIGSGPDSPPTKSTSLVSSTKEAAETQPSIAVLPFANLSGETADEYFSDGLTEEITNVLAGLRGLKVIARTSAFRFKGKYEDIRAIAQALDVSNILEGSVRRSGSRVRVTLQLIRASDGSHCLSKRYERELKDVFALEDEIAGDVARELRFHLGVAKRPTENVLAYEAYLEGRFNWHEYVAPNFKKGLQCFERALTLDRDYAAAYTGVAQCLLGLVTESGASALEFLPKAAVAARQALALDESDGEAHCVLGEVAAMLHYDWTAAAEHFQTALKLNPSTYVRAAYTLWFLVPQGRAEEMLAQSDAVLDRDPLNVLAHQLRAGVLYFARQYEEGAQACLRVLELDERFPRAIQTLSIIRSFQRQFEESMLWAERLVQILGRTHMGLFTLGMVHGEAGNSEATRLVLEELKNLPFAHERFPTWIGLIYAGLNDEENALHFFWQAVESREPTILWLRMLPRADRMRSNVQFKAMMQSMNLPPD